MEGETREKIFNYIRQQLIAGIPPAKSPKINATGAIASQSDRTESRCSVKAWDTSAFNKTNNPHTTNATPTPSLNSSTLGGSNELPCLNAPRAAATPIASAATANASRKFTPVIRESRARNPRCFSIGSVILAPDALVKLFYFAYEWRAVNTALRQSSPLNRFQPDRFDHIAKEETDRPANYTAPRCPVSFSIKASSKHRQHTHEVPQKMSNSRPASRIALGTQRRVSWPLRVPFDHPL